MAGLQLHRRTLGGAVAAPVDYTRFALALKSYEGANDNTTWRDISGNGRNAIIQGAPSFALTPNMQNGKSGYYADVFAGADSTVFLPDVCLTDEDFTVYMAVKVEAVTNCYLLLMADVANDAGAFNYIGINSADTNGYFQRKAGGTQGPKTVIAAGETAVLTYQFNRNGATIRKNGVVLASGLAYIPASFERGSFFGNQSTNQRIQGTLFALIVRVGNETAAEIAQIESALFTELGI